MVVINNKGKKKKSEIGTLVYYDKEEKRKSNKHTNDHVLLHLLQKQDILGGIKVFNIC